MIKLKRAYDPPDAHDGKRFLVDRLWPRGLKKENLPMDEWLKDISPSDSLRHWFGHDPDKWEDFQRRYLEELDKKHDALKPLLDAARKGTITLLYSAHDEQHNNALVLKSFLDEQLKKHVRAS